MCILEMGDLESKSAATGEQSSQPSTVNNQPSTSVPASGPAGSSTIRYPEQLCRPGSSYGTSPMNSVPTSSDVIQNTANGIPSISTVRSNASYQASSSPSGAQTSTSGVNVARISTPPVAPDSNLEHTFQSVKTESRSNEATRSTVACNLRPNNIQNNSQQSRSVEENVKNFDDVPQIPSLYYSRLPASELLNVPSPSSAAKMKQTHAKNFPNNGIGKHKDPKKNVKSNKVEFTQRTISEIENGFNLVTLQDNDKAGNTNRAKRTQVFRNEVQPNGISQDSISCPTCKGLMLDMVFQCQSGHSICESCCENLTEPNCPKCRIPMRHPIRNRALEDLIAKMKIPCGNSEKGCIFILPASNLRDHLDECIYRTIFCPIGNTLGCCFWKGVMKDLKSHFQNFHPTLSEFEPNLEMAVQNVNIDNRMLGLIAMGKFTFLLHMKVDMQQRRTYWLIQNIGTRIAAQIWTYEFHFYNKSQPGRKLSFAASCSSDSESADALFESLHCVMVPNDVLATFINAGRLNYKFYIRRMAKESKRSIDDPSSQADASKNRKNGSANIKKQ